MVSAATKLAAATSNLGLMIPTLSSTKFVDDEYLVLLLLAASKPYVLDSASPITWRPSKPVVFNDEKSKPAAAPSVPTLYEAGELDPVEGDTAGGDYK